MNCFRLYLSFLLGLVPPVIATSAELEKIWETEPVLKVPESVLYDEERQILFVSSIDGQEAWAKDTEGSIAKVALDGKIIDATWVEGLHAPKGLGLHKAILFVADVDRLVLIDVERGTITDTIDVIGAKRLNDVTITTDGIVYVSDSETGKIHEIKDGQASVLAEGFKSPNGVLAADGGVYVLSDEKLFLLTDRGRTVVAEGIKGHVDGVEKVGTDTFVVSDWNGAVYIVTKGHSPRKLLDTRDDKINAADIGYRADEKIVYVPTFRKNTVAAYRLK